MKKTNTIIAFLLVLVAVVGCKKDTDPAADEPEVKVIKVTPRQHGATFEWDVVDMPGKFQTCVELSRHDDMSDLFSLPAYETETSFVANIDTLTANTTYYYRYVVWNKFKRFEFEKGGTPFTTLETPTPGQDTTYYTISVSWQPEEGGTATGGGRIAEGDTCTLTATANEGYRFVNWTEGEGNSVADTAAIFSFVVTADRALVANFTSQEYTINAIADPTEGGVVEGWGGYNSGDECTLTAIANEGYEFVNWTKDDEVVSDEPDYPFTVTESATYVAHFQLKRYKIRVSATDGGAAYVGVMVGTLETTYTHGDTCVVHAIPEPDYHFVNWTELGIEASREENYRFGVTRERILVANFEVQAPNTYTIAVSAEPSNGGHVAGGGSFQQGQTCTVTATPNTGYDFVNWTENDTVVSTDAVYPFTVQGDRNLVAHFQVKSYTIRVMANGSNGSAYVGDIVGTIQATYTYGQTCWVHASANDGYVFANWTESDTIVSPNPNYRFEVKGDRTFVANFTELQPDEFSITVSANPSEGGEVEGAGVYEDGEECTLTAIPADCYKFTSWSDGSTANPHTVEVTGDAEYTANFERLTDTITVTHGTGGTAHVGSSTGPTSQPVACGASCTIYAVADEHYEFDNWTEGSTVVSSDSTHTVNNVTQNHTYKANFKKRIYHINVSANPTNGGTVSGGGVYEYNESCTVVATANANYTFTNWTENGTVVSSNASYNFTVAGNRNLVANFTYVPPTYTISVSANPTAGGSPYVGSTPGNTSGTYTNGQSCTVHANPATGYTFANWTENGQVVSGAGADYTFTVSGNRTLKANYTQQTYTISVSADPSSGGSPYVGSTPGNTSGTYTNGQSCTVHANPATGYTFLRWTENGTQVSTDVNYTFNVTGNRTLVAQFQVNSYTISVSANPTAGGSPYVGSTPGNTSGTYTHGQSCTVHANPATGYTFLRWTENGTQVSTDANYTFNVTGNRTLVAQFQINTYTINVSANPTAGGSPYVGSTPGNTSGTYISGQTCTVHANPASGYTFLRWTENGTLASTNPDYTFPVTGGRNLVAQFQVNSYTISVSANPTAGGTVSINGGGTSGTYTHGTTITLRANANAGYTFDHWQDGSTTNPRTITVTGNASYIAYFTAQPQAPTGALPGKFTINDNGDKVYFSQGNLQYIGSASTPYWKFADNQWECLGTTTGQNSTSQNVDRDLFGWGTSGYHDSSDPYNVNYQPWSITSHDSINGTYNWWGYGPSTNMPSPNLTGSSANYDWGVYNAINNGGGQADQWRTLTGGSSGEWNYIFYTRSASTVNGVANARYAKAKVANVQGMILFPDEYTHPGGVAQPVGINETGNAGWTGNNYSASDFASMQDAGAVFLPAAGYRNGTSVSNVGSYGYYWSASYYNSDYAWSVNFDDTNLNTSNYNNRCYGFTVRLVCPCQ